MALTYRLEELSIICLELRNLVTEHIDLAGDRASTTDRGERERAPNAEGGPAKERERR